MGNYHEKLTDILKGEDCYSDELMAALCNLIADEKDLSYQEGEDEADDRFDEGCNEGYDEGHSDGLEEAASEVENLKEILAHVEEIKEAVDLKYKEINNRLLILM